MCSEQWMRRTRITGREPVSAAPACFHLTGTACTLARRVAFIHRRLVVPL
jgi:hypothetical protein